MNHKEIPTSAENTVLFGHDAAEQSLLSQFHQQRLAHAWLITGPRGIGKATLAYRMARYILAHTSTIASERPKPDEMPGAEHPVFRRVMQGSHSDFLALRKPEDKTVISVDDARKLALLMNNTPAESTWRVVVVDSVDEMNTASANAILKVLEEPPVRAVIFLVSHAPGSLLPTIRSRCRTLPLHTLSEQDFGKALSHALPDIASQERQALFRLAEGSPGRALELHAADSVEIYAQMIVLLERFPAMDAGALYAFSDTFARKNADAAWRVLGELFRRLLGKIISAGGTGQVAAEEVTEGENAVILRLLDASPLDYWLDLWEKSAALWDKADHLHLERRQVVLNLFHELRQAA